MSEHSEQQGRIEGFGVETDRHLKEMVDSVVAARELKKGEEKRDRLQKEHNDQMMLRVTIMSVVVAIAATGVTIWYGHDSSENQKSSINAQIKAIELDERPYIVVNFAGIAKLDVFDENSGESIILGPQIDLFARGRTPAMGIKVKIGCTLSSEPNYPDPAALDQNWTEYDPGAMFPGDKRTIPCTRKLPWVVAEKPATRVAGQIRYVDLSTKPKEHHTPFCFDYFPSTKKAQLCGAPDPD